MAAPHVTAACSRLRGACRRPWPWSTAACRRRSWVGVGNISSRMTPILVRSATDQGWVDVRGQGAGTRAPAGRGMVVNMPGRGGDRTRRRICSLTTFEDVAISELYLARQLGSGDASSNGAHLAPVGDRISLHGQKYMFLGSGYTGSTYGQRSLPRRQYLKHVQLM